MLARIFVTLKQDVLDPQGKAVEGGLHTLGYQRVQSVRQGKLFDIELASTDHPSALREIDEMCKSLLANPVIENFEIMKIDEQG